MLGPVDILVYLALAKHADGEGTCWPSMATIAKVARVCRTKAFQAIKHLEARGYLRRTPRFRPDGGVTSNAYQLMPLVAQKYLAQEDTPPVPQQHPPVHPVNTNYTHLELNPNKERAEKAHRAAKSQQITQQPAYQVAPASLSALLKRIRQEAQTRGAPPCFIAGGWSSGIRELMSGGASEEEILGAFTACIEMAPERVTFFPIDFLKWRKVLRAHRKSEQREAQMREERQVSEGDRVREQEQLLQEREDPQWQEKIAVAVAQLPWRRRMG